ATRVGDSDGKMPGLGPFQNPVDVAAPTPIALSLVDAVGCEQASLDILAVAGDGRQSRGEREPRNLHTLRKEQTIHRHDDGLHLFLSQSSESGSEPPPGNGPPGPHPPAPGARGDARP